MYQMSLLMIGRYGRNAKLEHSGKVRSRIEESVTMLQEKLAAGELIYGEYMTSLIPVTSFFCSFSQSHSLKCSDDTVK